MANDKINLVNNYINNNYDKSGIDNLNTFSGFNQNIYVDPANSGFSFIFITKPCLYLYPQYPAAQEYEKKEAFNNLCIEPKLSYFATSQNLNKKDQLIIKQLSYFNFNDVTSLFLPIFTNLSKSFSATDINLDTSPNFQTKEGFNMLLPTTATMSETAGNLSISVSETANFDFLKLLTIWVTYIQNITNGIFTANSQMIQNNMLDYTSSIYYFVLDADGRTIRYWARYTGCYPISIPYSSLSYQKGVIDPVTYDIPFVYTLKEDMDPRILEDFNLLSLKLVGPDFSNNDYTLFNNNTNDTQTNKVLTYSNSPLLLKEKLLNGNYANIIKNDDRDPIIFYEQPKLSSVVPGETNGKFVLSFSKNTLNYNYSQVLLNSQKDFNYNELTDFDDGGNK